MEVSDLDAGRAMAVRRWSADERRFSRYFILERKPQPITVRLPQGGWEKTLDSADTALERTGQLAARLGSSQMREVRIARFGAVFTSPFTKTVDTAAFRV